MNSRMSGSHSAVSISVLWLLLPALSAWAAEEGMPGMPRIQPKRSYAIQSEAQGEEVQDQRGYGDQEPMVRMMNLMMVGGSGYEGMDMGAMSTVTKASAGAQTSGHGGHGMMMAAQDQPARKDGMSAADHAAHSKESVPAPAEGQTATYDIETRITPDPPKVGPNNLEIVLQNKNKKNPVRGLKLKAKVYMTSMDMGTEEPKVKEAAPGVYRVKVVFAMKGPWAVKILLPEGGEKVLNFDVGGT